MKPRRLHKLTIFSMLEAAITVDSRPSVDHVETFHSPKTVGEFSKETSIMAKIYP
jgi:hypothetical protein